MRLRKEIDEMQEKDILLIAKISDALAHPARIKIFRYIMQENKNLSKVCNKDLVSYFDYSQATISQHVKKLKDSRPPGSQKTGSLLVLLRAPGHAT